MPFAIAIGEDGQAICPCCRDHLWHCEKCWDEFHHGKQHKDYVEPEHYGQSMLVPKVVKTLKELNPKLLEMLKPSIKEDKNREYREGEYH